MRLVGGGGWCPVGGVSAQFGQCLGHRVGVELCGVEVGGVAEPEPLQHVCVAWMGGVGQGFGEVGVAPDAAAVLGRGGASSAGAAWIADRAVPVENLLHHDIVFPVVAGVVGVLGRAACGGGGLVPA